MIRFFAVQIRMHKHMSPHGDYDHMGEAINLVNTFGVSEDQLVEKIKKKNLDKNNCYIEEI